MPGDSNRPFSSIPPGHAIPSSRADAAGDKVGGDLFGTCGALGCASRTVGYGGAFGGALFGGNGGCGALGGAFGGASGGYCPRCRAAATTAAVSSTVRWGQSGTRIQDIA